MKYEEFLGDSRYTRRQRFDKAVNTLTGILEGIAIDDAVTAEEIQELKNWLDENRIFAERHPFSELIHKTEAILADGQIDPEEAEDMLWVCRNLSPGSIYFDQTTADLQLLHGILHGILADNRITDEEIHRLAGWIEEHSDLKGCYPYDEIDALLTHVLRDRVVDESERGLLELFFRDFTAINAVGALRPAPSAGDRPGKLSGICAVCPEVVFEGRTYAFTGTSTKATRSEMAEKAIRLGASFAPKMNGKVHYLVVGSGGNPAWAYSCYGRKVEQAMNLRSAGTPLIIIHENDFWDALLDH